VSLSHDVHRSLVFVWVFSFSLRPHGAADGGAAQRAHMNTSTVR
jgi:hypothetical protein